MNTELIAQLDAEIKAKQELKEIALAAEAGAEWEVALPLGAWMKPFQDIEYYVNNVHWQVRLKPKPVTRPWSKPEDVPLNCWLRAKGSDACTLVIWVDSCGVGCTSPFEGRVAPAGLIFSQLDRCEHSTDRINWKPCETTEEAK